MNYLIYAEKYFVIILSEEMDGYINNKGCDEIFISVCILYDFWQMKRLVHFLVQKSIIKLMIKNTINKKKLCVA